MDYLLMFPQNNLSLSRKKVKWISRCYFRGICLFAFGGKGQFTTLEIYEQLPWQG
jgi:hypothetical protein